jgi:hypothetical protein
MRELTKGGGGWKLVGDGESIEWSKSSGTGAAREVAAREVGFVRIARRSARWSGMRRTT